jgi:hypothetical protein
VNRTLFIRTERRPPVSDEVARLAWASEHLDALVQAIGNIRGYLNDASTQVSPRRSEDDDPSSRAGR